MKYIRQEIKYRRRHHLASLYRQQKWSFLEYRQTKILGRRKDRRKMQRALKAKIKSKPNRHERKLQHLYKRMATFGVHTKSSNISVTKQENHFKWPTDLLLSSYFHFPETTIFSVRSLNCQPGKLLLHYSNQHVFIYVMPGYHCKRTSKKYLINTISTLDDTEPVFFDNYRSSPIQPSQAPILVNPNPYKNSTKQSKQKTKKSFPRSKRTVK